jgi:hypothetical protein
VYIFDIDEVFPIDLDLENNVNQSNLRIRPEFIDYFIKNNDSKITLLSGGGLTYGFDDEEGER